ncbi:hypothetical protein [Arcticibacterium luteifluviistationis]|uniref:Fructose-1-6-bisphosphatase class 1 C-terminal domain-containing protein n=1 Tax=Arcticibacterium luteifluviistationis TaxID=1784714 RepID=A0A2Z4GE45_9BACT|nr:hypothetical protein [Arcticibacterium luteifluviistationis]AWV99589.1 hypothetical protein DJ013_15995 [Arcticibacterium luteifluviistationis]
MKLSLLGLGTKNEVRLVCFWRLLLAKSGVESIVLAVDVFYCQAGNDNKPPYKARYVGSLVADFHRNLIKGGIYMYPCSAMDPKGKSRLLYECNPIAFLAKRRRRRKVIDARHKIS